MAVWLSMSMSYVGAGDSANTSKVLVSVDVHWDYKHFNRDGGTLTVTLDGVSDTRTVPFNAGETSSGSQNIYNYYWNVSQPNGAAKTVYASATFQATSNTTATPASTSLYLSAISGSGGDSGGGETGGGTTGGGDSGGGTPDGGVPSGASKVQVTYILPPNAYVLVYKNNVLSHTVESSTIESYVFWENTRLTFEFNAKPGYSVVNCMSGEFQLNGNSVTHTTIVGDDDDLTLSCDVIYTENRGGVVYIDASSEFAEFEVYIDNGSEFVRYEAYTDNGTSWDLCT